MPYSPDSHISGDPGDDSPAVDRPALAPDVQAAVPLLEPPAGPWPSAPCSTCSTTPGAASPATSPAPTDA
ncbi:hypothetical protein [Streptomyces sp. B21-106]|uniref:hypothetical protein n=1 Tax=Streptomyces sp. B21-106 TaxID=3039418 RepID=UPI003FA6CFB6